MTSWIVCQGGFHQSWLSGCLVLVGTWRGQDRRREDVHEMVWGMALSLQAVCRSKSYRVIGLVKDVSRYKHERNV